jgi:cellulose synthase/poly-beta-1,6-N-acetylglucosamine synthase-like glycosyltransferase
VILLEILLCGLAAATLVPMAVLFLQVVMALPAYRARGMPAGRRPTAAIVVPAHDEALGIDQMLRSIALQLVAGDRLLVVADNCTDDTAVVAAAAGAEVIERKDPERRGKGYALDFAVRHLERRPPEVVVVVDADCLATVGTIDRLARLGAQTARPVQASYLMHSPPGAGLRTRIAEFAWLVKTWARPLGYHRLGLPCQLMGAGMAFPWPTVSSASLASGDIVEDLTLGISLTRAGAPPLFCPEARVTSIFPSSTDGARAQRIRWEHGHLAVILRDLPRLMVEAIRQGNVNLMALALDLCVPPLALLLLMVLILFAGSAIFFSATELALPLLLAAAALVLFVSAVLLAWVRYGRQVISLSDLAYAPFYALWKIPLYFKFLVRRQIEWVRSKRD